MAAAVLTAACVARDVRPSSEDEDDAAPAATSVSVAVRRQEPTRRAAYSARRATAVAARRGVENRCRRRDERSTCHLSVAHSVKGAHETRETRETP